jgi:hypothetical protein
MTTGLVEETDKVDTTERQDEELGHIVQLVGEGCCKILVFVQCIAIGQRESDD